MAPMATFSRYPFEGCSNWDRIHSRCTQAKHPTPIPFLIVVQAPFTCKWKCCCCVTWTASIAICISQRGQIELDTQPFGSNCQFFVILSGRRRVSLNCNLQTCVLFAARAPLPEATDTRRNSCPIAHRCVCQNLSLIIYANHRMPKLLRHHINNAFGQT